MPVKCQWPFAFVFSLVIRSVTSMYTWAHSKTDYKQVMTNQTQLLISSISEIFYLILAGFKHCSAAEASRFIIFTSVLEVLVSSCVLQHTQLNHLLILVTLSLCEQSKMQKALWVKQFFCLWIQHHITVYRLNLLVLF